MAEDAWNSGTLGGRTAARPTRNGVIAPSSFAGGPDQAFLGEMGKNRLPTTEDAVGFSREPHRGQPNAVARRTHVVPGQTAGGGLISRA